MIFDAVTLTSSKTRIIKLFTNLLDNKRMRIRFDNMLEMHTVTLDNTSILFAGTKDKCLDYVGSQLDQILAARR